MRLPSLIVAITVIIALVGGVGWYVISGGIEEFYSPGWFSASTENAKYRRVFVSSPVVMTRLIRGGRRTILASLYVTIASFS